MPPRFAFWTILIDGKPTAFRARDLQELLPTLNQLKRTSNDVVMRWFARGRLWESPEAERAASERPKPPSEKRNRDWRPGGAHKDPRDRFKKKNRPERAWSPNDTAVRRDRDKLGPPRDPPAAARSFTPAGPGARGPWTRKPQGDRKPWTPKPSGDRKPWTSKPAGDRKPRTPKLPSDRPWQTKPSGPRAQREPWRKPSGPPRGDRPWTGKPSGPPRGDRPWTSKPGGGAPRGDRKPFGKPFGKPSGPPRGDRPGTSKPAGGAPRGDRKPFGRPSGKPFPPRGQNEGGYRTDQTDPRRRTPRDDDEPKQG
jgi:hypothetical protein